MADNCDLIRVSRTDIQEVVSDSDSAFTALYGINPELASIAYAYNEGVLAPELMPHITKFRELQSNERISLMENLVEKLRIESEKALGKYQVDGQVRMVEIVDSGKTEREEARQGGKTERATIKADALLAVQKLEYLSNVRALEAHLEGQKYLSDNELRATSIMAEAHRDVVRVQETLRSETQLRVSKDRLEERVKTAAIGFASRVKEAEIARASNMDRNRVEAVTQYLRSKTEICLETLRCGLERDLAAKEMEMAKVVSETLIKSKKEETIQEVIKAIRGAIESGKDHASIEISTPEGVTRITYDSRDDKFIELQE